MKIRPWCAMCQYEGKEKFLFGTITMPDDARHDEVIAEMGAAIDKVLPTRPAILDLCAGALFFSPDDGGDK